jgi:GAF domain-containing protein
VLDTGPEPAYDILAELAAVRCNTPIALVALIDAEREWFKANIGLDGIAEMPRAEMFGNRTIAGDAVLEVPDASADPQFAASPLVSGDRHVRFYAGAPLIAPGGERIGALCVLDTTPRALGERERAQLTRLASLVVLELERRKRTLARADESDRRRIELLEARSSQAELVARLARGLRGPITSIVGFARLLEEDDRFPNDAREALGLVRASGQHIGDIADDIELLAQIERRAGDPRWRPLDVAALLRAVGAQVEVAGPTRIVGDANLLEMALQRLIERADAAGARVGARIESTSGGVALVLSGLGTGQAGAIPAGTMAVQLARRVAERHGGGLGVGGAGWLRMTLAADPTRVPPARSVLVVAHEPQELADRLGGLGFAVRTARSADEAATALEAVEVALVPIGRAPQGVGTVLAEAAGRVGLVALVARGEAAGERWDVTVQTPALPTELRAAVHAAATKARVRGRV